MVEVQCGRLNEDATWWVDWGGQRIVFDPWLVGSEVDFVRWFNEAWHTGAVVPPEEVGPVDVVVVSQPFSDHHHPVTLRRLSRDTTFVVPGCSVADSVQIPEWSEPPLVRGDLRVWRMTRHWSRPPTYHVIVLAGPDDHAIVHAPHGLSVPDAESIAARFDVDLLAITRSRYALPFFLGGDVNPGNDAAVRAARALGATHVLAIHDEDKRSVGLVSRLASVDRGPWLEDGLSWLEREPKAPGVPIGHTGTR